MQTKCIKEKLESDPEVLKNEIHDKALSLIEIGNSFESDQLAILLFEIDEFIKSSKYSLYVQECEERKNICSTKQNELEEIDIKLDKNIKEIFSYFMWFKDNHVKTSTSLLPNPRNNGNPEPIWHQIQLMLDEKGEKLTTDGLITLLNEISEQIDFFSVWPCEQNEKTMISLIYGKAIKQGKYLEFYDKIKEIEHIRNLIKDTESDIHKFNEIRGELQKNNASLWSSDINDFSNKIKSKLDKLL